MSPEQGQYQPTEAEQQLAESMMATQERFQSAHKIEKEQLAHPMESKYTTPEGNLISNITEFISPVPNEKRFMATIRDQDGVNVGTLQMAVSANITTHIILSSPRHQEVAALDYNGNVSDQDQLVQDISTFIDTAVNKYRSEHLANYQ